MSKKVLERFFQGKKSVYFWALILAGSITWSTVMVKSGLVYGYGMGFWGPNGHDGVWHIALAKSLARGSWGMPIFAGEALTNYHVGFDLLLAALHKITTIPVSTLYFQIIPPILALVIGLLTYKLVLLWRKSRPQALWALFFVYFGGSFGWMVTLLREGRIGGESMFWSQQAVSTLINPPFALSILLMLVGLILLQKSIKTRSVSTALLTILTFGVLVQVKVYAGILSLGGLFLAGLWQMFKRKETGLMKIFAGALVISIALFLPLNKGAQDTIVFKPFWFLETMMGLTDRVGWTRFGEAMVNYKLGNVWLKAIPAYLIAFLIFWYGNMGTRLISKFFVLKRIKDKKISLIEIFIFSVILAGVVIPMFFLQAGTPWNTIQFFYYSLFFSGILAGIFMGEFFEKKARGLAIFGPLVIILFTVPTTISTLIYHYLPARPPAKVSRGELEALKFLSTQPNGVVLTYPFDRAAAQAAVANPPRPLYLYESTAYVSAFADKPVYLEDEVNLDITGYDWRGRREEIEDWLVTNDHARAYNFLRENNLTYIYWLRGQRATLGESQLGITKVFENSEVDIYKVD